MPTASVSINLVNLKAQKIAHIKTGALTKYTSNMAMTLPNQKKILTSQISYIIKTVAFLIHLNLNMVINVFAQKYGWIHFKPITKPFKLHAAISQIRLVITLNM